MCVCVQGGVGVLGWAWVEVVRSRVGVGGLWWSVGGGGQGVGLGVGLGWNGLPPSLGGSQPSPPRGDAAFVVCRHKDENTKTTNRDSDSFRRRLANSTLISWPPGRGHLIRGSAGLEICMIQWRLAVTELQGILGI